MFLTELNKMFLPVMMFAGLWLLATIGCRDADFPSRASSDQIADNRFAQSVSDAIDVPRSVESDIESDDEFRCSSLYSWLFPSYRIDGGVPYRAVGNSQLHANIYLPSGEEPKPAIVVIHGGGWFFGSKSNWMRHARLLARNGFVVMAIDYRLAPEHKFPAQFHDARFAVKWLRHNASRYRVDPTRVAAFGYSAGGHLAAMLGTVDDDEFVDADLPEELRQISGKVDVVVAGGSPHEFGFIDGASRGLAYWLGKTPEQDPSLYRLAAPYWHVTADDAEFYLYHAALDQIVPVTCTELMCERLVAAGLDPVYEQIELSEHFGAFLSLKNMPKIIDFLKSRLR